MGGVLFCRQLQLDSDNAPAQKKKKKEKRNARRKDHRGFAACSGGERIGLGTSHFGSSAFRTFFVDTPDGNIRVLSRRRHSSRTCPIFLPARHANDAIFSRSIRSIELFFILLLSLHLPHRLVRMTDVPRIREEISLKKSVVKCEVIR